MVLSSPNCRRITCNSALKKSSTWAAMQIRTALLEDLMSLMKPRFTVIIPAYNREKLMATR